LFFRDEPIPARLLSFYWFIVAASSVIWLSIASNILQKGLNLIG